MRQQRLLSLPLLSLRGKVRARIFGSLPWWPDTVPRHLNALGKFLRARILRHFVHEQVGITEQRREMIVHVVHFACAATDRRSLAIAGAQQSLGQAPVSRRGHLEIDALYKTMRTGCPILSTTAVSSVKISPGRQRRRVSIAQQLRAKNLRRLHGPQFRAIHCPHHQASSATFLQAVAARRAADSRIGEFSRGQHDIRSAPG